MSAKNISRSPIVYLPIELRSRELDSKVTLAATLAGMGYPTVLGQQWMLSTNYSRMPAGTILFKSFNKIHHHAMVKAREAGHWVVTQEEELLGMIQEKVVTWTCVEGVFDVADAVLANGDFEAEIVKKNSDEKVRVEVTGNGRVDLLKPEYRKFFEKQTDDVRRRYGDFILVNTNFGIHNSVWRTLEEVTDLQERAGFINEKDPETKKIWDDYVVWERANIEGMHAAIRELIRRRPDQKIVIRPHPAEDLKCWDGLFPESKNIFVIREGSHVPWTLACQVLIHTCCTTGFEAFVAGKPALSLMPHQSWIVDSLITNRVNPVFQKPHDLIDAVEKVLDGGETPKGSGLSEAEHFVWNCTINNAFSRIASLLIEGLPPPGEIRLPPLSSIGLEERLKVKFDVSYEECADTLARAADAIGLRDKPECISLQDGIFLIVPAGARGSISILAPLLNAEQAIAAMETAFRARDLQKVLDLFNTNLSEIEQSSPCWFLAGVALFELGRHAEALQHFQNAEATAGPEKNFQLLFMLAVVHRQLGQVKKALGYAEQAHRQAPADQRVFELYKSLQPQTGGKPPKKK